MSMIAVGKPRTDLLQDACILTQMTLVLYSMSNFIETDEITPRLKSSSA